MQNWIHTIAVLVQVLSALGVILLVLLQHGKGADMGAAFGSGASGSLFGATGSANFLSRSTGVLAGLFLASTLALAFMSNDRPRASESLMQGATPAGPAGAIPATRPPQAPPDVPTIAPGGGASSVPGGAAGSSAGASGASSVPPAPSSGGSAASGSAAGTSGSPGTGSGAASVPPASGAATPNAANPADGSKSNPK